MQRAWAGEGGADRGRARARPQALRDLDQLVLGVPTAIAERYAEVGVELACLGMTEAYRDACVGNTAYCVGNPAYTSSFEYCFDAISAADCSTVQGINSLTTAAATYAPKRGAARGQPVARPAALSGAPRMGAVCVGQ